MHSSYGVQTKVLLVEDSRTFGAFVSQRIQADLGTDVAWTMSLAETRELILREGHTFFMALLDINLPDAPDGQVVDEVLSKGIPAAVFTGEISDDLRDLYWSKQIIDYVTKDSIEVVDYVVRLVARIRANAGIGVAVVDDSSLSRRQMTSLLRAHRYIVYDVENGEACLDLLTKHPDIKLVITDYNMAHMDGFMLTREIRKRYSKDVLSIIGISAHGGLSISARFIKSGANDYLNKPFVNEEFYCRVSQNVEMIELINNIREYANKDYLTGISNRRHFFEQAQHAFDLHKDAQLPCAMVIIDIDDFKGINDSFGHDVGDKALHWFAQLLADRFGQDHLVARFGGEEFSIFLRNVSREEAFQLLDALREHVGCHHIPVGEMLLRFTISIGVSFTPQASLETMIKQADDLLYSAKHSGRNRVVVEKTSK
ncbi:diguanylate cyclase [Desulfovibrio inopinatus]|uniref:diguanylate cyclase n=1 Tax=Desulfovibrio inopinatus TaxID=102109 RepID=UPI000425C3D3|nr:diguanylate cyclase [Desulfovibrio inopinatus]